MFDNCRRLEVLDLSKFNPEGIISARGMFYDCNSLRIIRCTEEFKNWCLNNKYKISLPSRIIEEKKFTWDIID